MQKKSKSQTTNMIAAKLAAFQASQSFRLSQGNAFKGGGKFAPSVKRAKKRGDR
jgi:hypothetical protein